MTMQCGSWYLRLLHQVNISQGFIRQVCIKTIPNETQNQDLNSRQQFVIGNLVLKIMLISIYFLSFNIYNHNFLQTYIANKQVLKQVRGWKQSYLWTPNLSLWMMPVNDKTNLPPEKSTALQLHKKISH